MGMRLARCERCNGAIILERDLYGSRHICLACGREVGKRPDASDIPPEPPPPPRGRRNRPAHNGWSLQ